MNFLAIVFGGRGASAVVVVAAAILTLVVVVVVVPLFTGCATSTCSCLTVVGTGVIQKVRRGRDAASAATRGSGFMLLLFCTGCSSCACLTSVVVIVGVAMEGIRRSGRCGRDSGLVTVAVAAVTVAVVVGGGVIFAIPITDNVELLTIFLWLLSSTDMDEEVWPS